MHSLDQLLYLMSRLRNPEDGCPWDIQQNYRSITPSTIEEAYEVVDAIERENYAELQEELGDLLFQVVFYSRLAEEEGRFDFYEVIHVLTEKLLRRHPHVFPGGTLQSRREKGVNIDQIQVKQSWESIKSDERKNKGKLKTFDDIPANLPAVTRALKIQKRAAKEGFDWREVQSVFAKLQEEFSELESAVRNEDEENMLEEIGDVLFTVINLSRHLKADPEQALRESNLKFSRRFQAMEALLHDQGTKVSECDDATLDEYWEKAKQGLR